MHRLAALRRFVPYLPLALYVSLVAWTTWPVVRAPFSVLPIGTEPVATVPMFNLWTIWWNVDRLGHAFGAYWNSPIFHPVPDTFAFSEVQPLTVVVAPVVWITGSRVLAYNVWLWLSLLLNGVFAERLLRDVGVTRWVAVGGGAAMILLPIVHWQLGVEQLVPLWGILWTFQTARRATREPTVHNGALVGLAFSTAYLLCGHHGLFLSVLLLAGGVWFPGTRLFSRRAVACWAAAGGVALVVAGPFVWKHEAVFAQHEGFERSEDTARGLSLKPIDYTIPNWPQLVDVELHGEDRGSWAACPGWIKIALALFGVGFGLWRRRLRRWTAWLLTVGLFAFGLSQGPRLFLFGWQPWPLLVDHYPGFEQVRNVFRFAYFVQLGVVLFAAVGLHGLVVLARCCTRGPAWRWGVLGVLTAIGLAGVFEIRPAAPRTSPVPDVAPHRGWFDFVRTETPSGRAVACLPFAPGRRVGNFEVTTTWMYFGTFHGRPLSNGYSGFFPTTYNDNQRNLIATNGVPDGATLVELAEQGVEFVVADRDEVPYESLAFAWYDRVLLQHVYPAEGEQDNANVDVWRIVLDP